MLANRQKTDETRLSVCVKGNVAEAHSMLWIIGELILSM